MQARVNCELCKLSIWFRANQLSLNVDKTNYIIFGNKHLPNDSSLNMDDTVIQHVNSTKFLGVYIDSTLSWNIHVNHVASKIAQGIGALNRAKFIVPRSVLLSLYYSLIYPYLQYCKNIIWRNANSTLLND